MQLIHARQKRQPLDTLAFSPQKVDGDKGGRKESHISAIMD